MSAVVGKMIERLSLPMTVSKRDLSARVANERKTPQPGLQRIAFTA
jgi:hypothetical protein